MDEMVNNFTLGVDDDTEELLEVVLEELTNQLLELECNSQDVEAT